MLEAEVEFAVSEDGCTALDVLVRRTPLATVDYYQAAGDPLPSPDPPPRRSWRGRASPKKFGPRGR